MSKMIEITEAGYQSLVDDIAAKDARIADLEAEGNRLMEVGQQEIADREAKLATKDAKIAQLMDEGNGLPHWKRVAQSLGDECAAQSVLLALAREALGKVQRYECVNGCEYEADLSDRPGAHMEVCKDLRRSIAQLDAQDPKASGPICPECKAEPLCHRLGCPRINSNAPFPSGCGAPRP